MANSFHWMKWSILTGLLFSFVCVSSQNIIIQYEFEQNIFGLPQEQLEQLNIDLGENAYREKSTLKIYSNFSIWMRDSFSYFMERGDEPIKLALRPEIYVKVYSDGQLFESDANFEKRNELRAIDVSAQNNWEIDRKKTKNILGMKCFLARKVKRGSSKFPVIEAWFTEEIPYPDCPLNDYAFQLPGVILELNIPSINKHLRAIDIDLLEPSTCKFEGENYSILPKYDNSERNAYYRSLDRSSPYILSEETPQNVWLPYPKE